MGSNAISGELLSSFVRESRPTPHGGVFRLRCTGSGRHRRFLLLAPARHRSPSHGGGQAHSTSTIDTYTKGKGFLHECITNEEKCLELYLRVVLYKKGRSSSLSEARSPPARQLPEAA